jgi:molybdopterin-binding protein
VILDEVVISKIEVYEDLHIVYGTFHAHTLVMVSLELDADIVVGKTVVFSIKPTHVAFGKEIAGDFSFSNILPAKVYSLEDGARLSAVTLEVEGVMLESIITMAAKEHMHLVVGDSVSIMIKASEFSMRGVLS